MTELPALISRYTDLEELAQRLRAQPAFAVDTEANSLYVYQERVCLLQISIPGQDYVVDTLAMADLAPLADLFASHEIEKTFHAAEYDLICLKRDFGLSFANLFDTMIAARVLGWKQVGLASILQEQFGITLDKRYQRANWGARPLTQEQLAYARKDTHYLLHLRDLQKGELERLHRLDEAREEFARMAQVEPPKRAFDPDRYISIDGARDLDPVGLGILRELYRFREARAKAEDRPPFRVIANTALLHLALEQPTTEAGLKHVPGLGEWAVRKYAKGLLQAIERGRAAPVSKFPRPHQNHSMDPAARDRVGKLKEWRKARAEARGVEPDVIVSNDVLFAIAVKRPRTIQELVEDAGMGEWKAQEYGEELLTLVNGAK